jgi:NAD(P)-dependent dehydrogenase (short-subunit alcohol dehydrogenase family)
VSTDRRLDSQVVVVFGAAGAIGQAVARRAGEAGASLVLVDRSAAGLSELSGKLDRPGAMTAIECDMTDARPLADVFRTVEEEFGRLDVLVNAAGITHVGKVTEVPIEEWKRVLDVNATAPYATMQHAVGIMRRQSPLPATGCRGKIVNISSAAAEVPRPWSPAYGASKAALNAATRSVAAACVRDRIAATLVYPGNVKSDLFDDIARSVSAAKRRSYQDFLDERLAGTPTGALQEPSAVADIVVFAACAVGMHLTGKTIWTEAHVSSAADGVHDVAGEYEH